MNESTKPWWASRTIIGAIVVLVAQVASAFGVVLDDVQLTDTLVEFASIAGALLAIIGRVGATDSIGRSER